MKILKRTGSDFFWYDFQIDGQRYRGSTKRLDKAEANRVLNTEYRKVLDRKQHGTKEEITLRDAFMKTVNSVTGRTSESYELVTRRMLGIAPFDRKGHWSMKPDRLVSSLTQKDIEDHIEHRVKEGLAPNSVNVEVRVFRRAINAVSRLYQVNADIQFREVAGFVKTRFLTDDELLGTLEVLKKKSKGNDSYSKAHDFLTFLVTTGVRLSEALSLRWADVDLSRGTVEIFRQKTKTVSVLPLSQGTITMLHHRQNYPTPFPEMTRTVKLLRWAIDSVCNTDPRVITTRGKATIHSLRDTYASGLVRKGMSLQQIKPLLGHSSASMSAKYAHLESKDVIDMARSILDSDTLARN